MTSDHYMTREARFPAPLVLRSALYHSPKLIVQRSSIHRWGVFALESIAEYELLEEVPYFLVPRAEVEAIPACNAYTYGFSDSELIIGMGFAGLYNHCSAPNVDCETDRANQTIRHYAIRSIDAGEELTIDYGDDNAQGFPAA